ncbi:hypothetical protein FOZ63_030842, partial [Perkinsus olseni]
VRLGIHLLISAVYQLGMAIMAELEGDTFDRWRSSMASLLERVENLSSACGDKAAGSVFFSQLAFISYYDDSMIETEGKARIFKLVTLPESRNKTVVDTRLFINSVEDGSGTYLPDIDSSEVLVSQGRGGSRRPTLVPPVGDAELESQTKKLARELFIRKTKPITLINRHSEPLTVRLYNRMDQICAIPVGGLKGPGVGTAKEGKRLQLRPPSVHDIFWMKVFPAGSTRAVYNCEVHRGQTWELRGHDASLLGSHYLPAMVVLRAPERRGTFTCPSSGLSPFSVVLSLRRLWGGFALWPEARRSYGRRRDIIMTASVRRIRMADSGLRNSGGSAVSHGFSLSSSIGSSVYSSMEVPRTEYDQLSPSSSSSSSRSTDEASPASRGMQVGGHHLPKRKSLVDDFVTSSYQAPDAEVSLDLTPTSVCSSAPQRTEQVIPNMLSTESVPPEVSNEPVEETEVTPEVQPPDDDDVLAGYLAAARTEPKRRSPGKPPLSRSSSSPTLATAIRNVRRSMGALSDPDSPEKPTSEAESPDRSTERGSLNSVCGFGSPVRPFSIDRVAEGEIEIPVVERLQGAVICAEDLDACE